jgi:hypothetical protein
MDSEKLEESRDVRHVSGQRHLATLSEKTRSRPATEVAEVFITTIRKAY